jgi:hypothetical protein
MCLPKRPKMPDLPPERAAQRLPNRGMVSGDARRAVEATYGTRNAPATALAGSMARSVGGAVRATSSATTSNSMSSILGG